MNLNRRKIITEHHVKRTVYLDSHPSVEELKENLSKEIVDMIRFKELDPPILEKKLNGTISIEINFEEYGKTKEEIALSLAGLILDKSHISSLDEPSKEKAIALRIIEY